MYFRIKKVKHITVSKFSYRHESAYIPVLLVMVAYTTNASVEPAETVGPSSDC